MSSSYTHLCEVLVIEGSLEKRMAALAALSATKKEIEAEGELNVDVQTVSTPDDRLEIHFKDKGGNVDLEHVERLVWDVFATSEDKARFVFSWADTSDQGEQGGGAAVVTSGRPTIWLDARREALRVAERHERDRGLAADLDVGRVYLHEDGTASVRIKLDEVTKQHLSYRDVRQAFLSVDYGAHDSFAKRVETIFSQSTIAERVRNPEALEQALKALGLDPVDYKTQDSFVIMSPFGHRLELRNSATGEYKKYKIDLSDAQVLMETRALTQQTTQSHLDR